MKLSMLAAKVGGHVENCGTDVEIVGVASINEAEAGQIAHVGNAAEREESRQSRASAFITAPGLKLGAVPRLCGMDPYLLYARVVEIFQRPQEYEPGIHPTAVIHPSAKVGVNASIGAYVVIDRDAEIGDGAVLLPHVVIYRGARIGRNFFAHAHAVVREGVRIGDNVVVQNGAVIGTDGFGFVKEEIGGQLARRKVLHAGSVVLGDNVEVQSNSCIDRSDDGDTRIASGVKIGDLVHVAHKAVIGANSLLLPQVAVAGRARIGQNVVISGQAGVAGNCEIDDNAVVLSQSGVIGRIEAGKIVSGFPAIDHREYLRSFAVFRQLPNLVAGLRRGSSKRPRASSKVSLSMCSADRCDEKAAL